MTWHRENTDYYRHYRRTFIGGPDPPGTDRGPASILGGLGGGISEICRLPVCAGGSVQAAPRSWIPAAYDRHRPAVVVVNYESAWRLEKALAAWHPDLIIADEGHKIKTHNIAASKAMHRMGAKASYRPCSPVRLFTNKAIDVFSQYKFLNPAIYGTASMPANCYFRHGGLW